MFPLFFARQAANAALPAAALTLATQAAFALLPGGAAFAAALASNPAPVEQPLKPADPAPATPKHENTHTLTADDIAKHMDDFYMKNRQPDGLRDWSQAVTSMNAPAHQQTAVSAGYEAYIKTLRKSYDGALAAIKGQDGAVKNGHLTTEYFKDYHGPDGKLTKNALYQFEAMGFDVKGKTAEEIIKQATDLPLGEYCNRFARMNATDAARKEAQAELDKAPAPATAPATNPAAAPADANNVNFNLNPAVKWEDGQMAKMLNDIPEGGTAKFMQWTAENNFIINTFTKKEGKFTQVVNGDNKGDGLSIDEMVARADQMRLPSAIAQKPDVRPQLSFTHQTPRFSGPNELSRGWRNAGEPVQFNVEKPGLDAALAKYSLGGRLTPDAAAAAQTTPSLKVELGGNKPLVEASTANPTLLVVEQGGATTRPSIPGMSA